MGGHAAQGADTREKILLAARHLHAGRCFEKISVRDIADEAGVNLALIYYHFGDKSALRDALFESLFAGLFHEIEIDLASRKGAWNRLARVAERFVDHIAAFGHVHRIVLHGVVASGACRPALVDRHMGALHTLLRGIVADGMATSEFCKGDPDTIARLLMGSLIHVTTDARGFGIDGQAVDAKAKRHILAQFERLFRSGLDHRNERAGRGAGR
ncbi:MAG: TetR/AcrR family transcriptional regulator, partial [Deltaproteobacteria bacterium]|nr:TetR/AcrR family transcriptional regulator [Deltaproteobacteria bacterium]